MKPHIYTLGETVLDLIFHDNQLTASRPGGSLLNSSISLGRLQIPVSFISSCGSDKAGKFILSFLKENNINTQYISSSNKTTLVLAWLDKEGKATYDFYGQNAPALTTTPAFKHGDWLATGSTYAITPHHHPHVIALLKKAHDAGVHIFYDPNFRDSWLIDYPGVKERIIQNISYATITKGSDEDFLYLFNTRDPQEIYHHIKNSGCRQVIITRGQESTLLCMNNTITSIQTAPTNIVSTIGAGDTFSAGLLAELVHNRCATANEKMIARANSMAAEVCSILDNYISLTFAKTIIKQWDHQ